MFRGALVGAAFGFAASTVEIGLSTIGKLKVGTAAPFSALIEALLLEVGLGLALGLAAAPISKAPRGEYVHVLAIGVAWVGLGLFAGLPEVSLYRTLAVVPWAVATALVLLGIFLRRRGRLVELGVLSVVLVVALVAPEVDGALHRDGAEIIENGGAPTNVPDLVVVVLDTVRADHIGAAGYERAHTPTLDRLAREGALFEDASAPSTWSLPSHASLFTGRFAASHGAHGEHRFLDAEHPTLAQTMQAAGYDTRCFTANAWITDRMGLTRGFAWSDEAWRSGDVGRTRLYAFRLLDRLGLHTPDNGGALVASNFEAWAEETPAHARPTFAFINFIEAHFPYHQVPDEYLRRFTNDDRGELRELSLALMDAQFGGEPPDAAQAREPATAMYDAGVSYADHLLGRVVEALHARGTLDETILIVLSDHGESLSEHGAWGHGNSVYEVETRVPLLIRFPRRVEAGSRSARPVSTVGVYATALDLAEIDTPDSLQVGSLLASLEEGPPSGPVIAERFSGHDATSRAASVESRDPLMRSDLRFRSFRSGSLKLVEVSDGSTLLFDLAVDRGEERDIAAEDPARLGRIRGELDAWRAAIGLPDLDAQTEGGEVPALDEAARERLRALGYVP